MIITIQDKNNFDIIQDLFIQQFRNEIITPYLTSNIDFIYSSQNETFLKNLSVTFEKDKIKGLMFYYEFTFKSKKDLDNFLSSALICEFQSLENKIFDNLSYGSKFTYLQKIESFERKKGYGKDLINSLKQDDSIHAIFLESLDESQDFYKKQNFIPVSYGDENDVIYMWSKNNY